MLSLFVADGAGSAARGGDGAELAVQAAADFVAAQLSADTLALDRPDLPADCIGAIRAAILGQAEAQALVPRDFACTFLGLVSSPSGTLVFQVGDGGIVVDLGQGLEVPFVPMTGEYANMTHFVTEDDALRVLEAKFFPHQARLAAVFSDGLQRLALKLDTNTAHGPFFEPFFRVLKTATPEQEDDLHAALRRFLASSPVNERTDDDKSLALAALPE